MGWLWCIDCEQIHCGGWSETLSDRLVDRLETMWVRSGGRVAGFGEVRGSLVWRDLKFVVLR